MSDPPSFPLKPMLSFSIDLPFDSADHLFEAKWDGVRCLASFGGDRTCLYDRFSRDVTFRYPELEDVADLFDGKEVLVDGEIIVLMDGKPDITRLRIRESLTDSDEIRAAVEHSPALFIVFDILQLEGRQLVDLPLLDRKDLLKSSLHQGRHLVAGTFVDENGKTFFDQMIRAGFEGMMAKQKSSRYFPGERSANWLKIKQFKTQDCLICGYTTGMGKRAEMLGALVLGVYHNGVLLHVGQVGSGFSGESLRNVFEILQSFISKECPFMQEPTIDRPTTWVRPEMVCRVEYAEWTSDAKLRLARFVELRNDKPGEECTIEELGQFDKMG